MRVYEGRGPTVRSQRKYYDRSRFGAAAKCQNDYEFTHYIIHLVRYVRKQITLWYVRYKLVCLIINVTRLVRGQKKKEKKCSLIILKRDVRRVII